VRNPHTVQAADRISWTSTGPWLAASSAAASFSISQYRMPPTLVAWEAADFQRPWCDTAWLHRPDVDGGRDCAPNH
jgi:hypothetical protein